ncbi:hypothetical protein B0T11DRAFT_67834 [Plectosphaerella cucumerina]|uniref:Uncharacterized protein n=1 Tax=Plectosphaerella cucumerina TaxID=40658 RepID=A0A8K0TKF5_9PEZI|nr:hypothetical protein B0T11DRAFT_67834 [Plectosphaerella cucumerina]
MGMTISVHCHHTPPTPITNSPYARSLHQQPQAPKAAMKSLLLLASLAGLALALPQEAPPAPAPDQGAPAPAPPAPEVPAPPSDQQPPPPSSPPTNGATCICGATYCGRVLEGYQGYTVEQITNGYCNTPGDACAAGVPDKNKVADSLFVCVCPDPEQDTGTTIELVCPCTSRCKNDAPDFIARCEKPCGLDCDTQAPSAPETPPAPGPETPPAPGPEPAPVPAPGPEQPPPPPPSTDPAPVPKQPVPQPPEQPAPEPAPEQPVPEPAPEQPPVPAPEGQQPPQERGSFRRLIW